jgi:hypothetical protein
MALMYKATKSFSGIISMKKGDVREIKDDEIAKDLIRAGYVTELADESKPKTTSSSKKSSKKGDIKDGDLDG